VSTNYHTPITMGAAANASVINAPLGELDAKIATMGSSWDGVYNVLDYGASPSASGATNSGAIQMAINAAIASDVGGEVLIPPGVYALETGLTITPSEGSTILLRGGASRYSWASGLVFSGTGSIITVSGTGCEIERLKISSNHANAGHGIHLDDAPHTTMRDVWVSGVQYNVVMAENSWSCLTENCIFDATLSDAGYAGYNHYSQCHWNTHVHTWFIHSLTNYGVIVGDSSAASAVAFYGCCFEGTGIGIWFKDCNSCILDDSYTESCDPAAVVVGGAALNISQVNITNNYFNIPNTKIGVDVRSCYHCVIDGNQFYNASSATGIKVAPDLSVHGLEIRANRNICDTPISDPLYRAGGSRNSTITYAPAAPVANGVIYQIADIVYNKEPASAESIGWVCTQAGRSALDWVAETIFATGQYIVSTTGYRHYYCKVGGTTSTTAPTHTSGDATDGGCTWTYVSDNINIAVFKAFGTIA
jgi:hypothetical protein